MFAERYPADQIASALLDHASYRPFPTADDHPQWDALPADLRQAALASAEDLRGMDWPPLPASLYLDFSRTGDRRRYEGPYFGRRRSLGSLVIAECIEAQGRFLDDILNGIWAICEESSWCIPAHNWPRGLPDATNPIIDLFAAETGGLLAWTHYLLRPHLDALDERILPRLRAEVTARILDPFLARRDFGWMGFNEGVSLNNWSPWCTSTCLASSLLLEPDEARRAETVAKSLGILDRWLAGYHPDGGCDEGPSYWTVAGAALLDCLELLRTASDGAIDVYDDPLIGEIGRYIHRVHISGRYFVDFADSPARVHLPAALVYRYGRRIDDPDMIALARYCYQQSGPASLLGGSLLRLLPALFDSDGIDTPDDPPLERDVWLDGTQIMAARETGGSDRGFYLAAKGGHNDECHNHNDVGQFIVYCDGRPVLIDAGVGTYTAQTFSDQRYDIWTMQSAYHNLPTVNDVQQQPGRDFAAVGVSYQADDASAQLSLDIAPAYPPSAGILSWQRTCRFFRGTRSRVEVTDDFSLAAPTQAIALSLMTPCRPVLEGPGAVLLQTDDRPVRLTFDGAALSALVEEIPLDDDSLRSSWGDTLYRIVLTPQSAVERGAWTIRIA